MSKYYFLADYEMRARTVKDAIKELWEYENQGHHVCYSIGGEIVHSDDYEAMIDLLCVCGTEKLETIHGYDAYSDGSMPQNPKFDDPRVMKGRELLDDNYWREWDGFIATMNKYSDPLLDTMFDLSLYIASRLNEGESIDSLVNYALNVGGKVEKNSPYADEVEYGRRLIRGFVVGKVANLCDRGNDFVESYKQTLSLDRVIEAAEACMLSRTRMQERPNKDKKSSPVL